ncbi:extracellular solute-binding protein [Schleiferilactobacillus harbinensis]|uniref:extracellular solute-binding protein n=1 Tax=Schleiferilactobacillus harbinensis TaxID=304207 RepID=UPI002672CCCE|nr:extracellular solute-binding protein [Schleiferilactobacillus harbinensis]MCI1686991.1 extracellular solute-binding protein [Schleiferilactobacillus harbinensis]
MGIKKIVFGMGAIAVAGLLLAACGAQNSADTSTKVDTAELKPYGKYKEPITFTIGKQQRDRSSLFKGDTINNNPATRYLKQETNISVNIAWEAADFPQKVSLVMSTQDLPDVMGVYQDQFTQLANNDLLADLTEVYKKAASPTVKKNMSSYSQNMIKIASRDGKLLGIPSPYPYGEENMLWIRKDWLDKVGLPVPETLDDVENAAKTFIAKDVSGTGKTMGITLTPQISGHDGAQMDGDLWFNQFNAFPSSMIKKDGKVVYGSIQPETKQTLTMLARWYKEGLIDKEFATRTDDEKKALLAKQMGIYVAPFWGLDFTNSYEADKNANWIAILPVLKKGDKFISTHPAPVFRYIVVKKGYKHPEAVMRAINNVVDFNESRGSANAFRRAEAKKAGQPAVSLSWLLDPIDVQITNAHSTDSVTMDKALKNNDPSGLKDSQINSYSLIKAYMDHKDRKGLETYLASQVGAKTANSKNVTFIDKAFYGQTKAMTQMGPNLQKLENEAFIKIIMGQAPISSFDTYVKQWKAQGGDTIVKEVQDAVDKGQVQ